MTSSASSTTLPGLTIAEVRGPATPRRVQRAAHRFGRAPGSPAAGSAHPPAGPAAVGRRGCWPCSPACRSSRSRSSSSSSSTASSRSWQEYRADRPTQRLRRAAAPAGCASSATGGRQPSTRAELVVGDLVLLERRATGWPPTCGSSTRTGCASTSRWSPARAAPSPTTPGDALMAGTSSIEGEAHGRRHGHRRPHDAGRHRPAGPAAQRPPSPLTVELHRVVRIVAVVAALTGVLLGAAARSRSACGSPTAFLFGVGVAVALVPEGLLPTVTLSLARGAQTMAGAARHWSVGSTPSRRSGATTFICTDKTGTLTQNRMSVVEVVTPAGHGARRRARLRAGGRPVTGRPRATARLAGRRRGRAAPASTGRAVRATGDDWVADGDPMEAAIHCLALRARRHPQHGTDACPGSGCPTAADRMISSCLERRPVVGPRGARAGPRPVHRRRRGGAPRRPAASPPGAAGAGGRPARDWPAATPSEADGARPAAAGTARAARTRRAPTSPTPWPPAAPPASGSR